MRLFFALSNWNNKAELVENQINNILFAYPYATNRFLKGLDDYVNEVKNINMLVDSGAFSAWTLRKEIDREKYLNFAKEMTKRYRNKVNSFNIVNLDKIPGDFGRKPTNIERENSAQIGLDNFHYFLKNGIKTIPVFHQHEDIKWLKLMEKETDYIGISPANDCSTKNRIKWLDKVYSYLRDRVKTHSFGGVSKSILERYPLYSGDSSSWATYNRWGRGNLVKTKIKPLGKDALSYMTGKEIKTAKKLGEYITKLWLTRGVKWS